MNNLKLTIEMVPYSSWGNNLRSVLTPTMWAELRKKVITHAGSKCEVCDRTKNLHCHEVWSYDDKSHIQKLERLQALCSLCHSVKHIGYTGTQGEKSYNIAVKHFMKINEVDKTVFLQHIREEQEKFIGRSQYEWDLDLDYLKNF